VARDLTMLPILLIVVDEVKGMAEQAAHEYYHIFAMVCLTECISPCFEQVCLPGSLSLSCLRFEGRS